MSNYNLTVAVHCILGEGPHWSAERQLLYYVDILGNNVHRFNPITGENTTLKLNGRPGFIVPVDQDPTRFIVGLERDLVLLEWDGVSTNPASTTTLHTVDDEYPLNRWNDGKCDSQGRLWAGTMYDGPFDGVRPVTGSLYSLDLNGSIWRHERGIGVSNGLAWNDDNTKMFYIDSDTNRVDSFDFSNLGGSIVNRQPVFTLAEHGIAGRPDGMTIDTDGNIWVATYGGEKVHHINPTAAQLLKSIDIPSKNVTSMAFGGPDLDELYVTTSRAGFTQEELAAQPAAGTLFKLTNLGVRGTSGGISYKGRLPSSVET